MLLQAESWRCVVEIELYVVRIPQGARNSRHRTKTIKTVYPSPPLCCYRLYETFGQEGGASACLLRRCIVCVPKFI